jgi:lactate dehydrogenase-like 2-hydroxyacid dehydrogenase
MEYANKNPNEGEINDLTASTVRSDLKFYNYISESFKQNLKHCSTFIIGIRKIEDDEADVLTPLFNIKVFYHERFDTKLITSIPFLI